MWPNYASAENHRVCVRWDWLTGEFGYTDASPRPAAVESQSDLGEVGEEGSLEPDWEVYGETENVDAEEDRGRRDTPEDFVAQSMLARVRFNTTTLWGWAPLDENGCTGTFDTNESEIILEWVSWTFNEDDDHIVALECNNLWDDCELQTSNEMLEVLTGVTDILYEPDLVDPFLRPVIAMLWAMTFAEDQHSYHDNLVVYGVHWDSNVNLPGAVTNTGVANRPTVNLRSGSQDQKYTVAHEYGHVQTLLHIFPDWATVEQEDLVNFCYPTCGEEEPVLNHSLHSVEWQGAAAVEGFAHFYSMSVWNESGVGVLANPGEHPWEILAYKSTDTHTNGAGTFESLLQYQLTNSCTGQDPEPCVDCVCSMGQWTNCDCSGAANELDWNFYLWDLLGGSPALDIDDVMHFLYESYAAVPGDGDGDPVGWPSAGDPSWWSEFAADIQALYQQQGEQDRITDEAEDRGIDQ